MAHFERLCPEIVKHAKKLLAGLWRVPGLDSDKGFNDWKGYPPQGPMLRARGVRDEAGKEDGNGGYVGEAGEVKAEDIAFVIELRNLELEE